MAKNGLKSKLSKLSFFFLKTFLNFDHFAFFFVDALKEANYNSLDNMVGVEFVSDISSDSAFDSIEIQIENNEFEPSNDNLATEEEVFG